MSKAKFLNNVNQPWRFEIDSSGDRCLYDSTNECFQSDCEFYPWTSPKIEVWLLQAAAPELFESLNNLLCKLRELEVEKHHSELSYLIHKAETALNSALGQRS